MATLKIATAMVAATLAASGADAQRMTVQGPGATYQPPRQMGFGPAPQPGFRPAPHPTGFRPAPHGQHWGSNVNGHWIGGVRAPGGWSAYRRPYRGFVLPSYWIAPTFFISDFADYGLPQPPQGYNWSRYYDDAVLIDSRGSVYDSVDGLDWSGGDACETDACVANSQAYYQGSAGYPQGSYYQADGYGQQGGYPQQGGYAQAGTSYDYRNDHPERRDNGVGGALAGAAVGGVAGNLIAGRGNRLGGTLIGAGVGAAAGYAIDKSEDRGRRPPPPPPYPDRGASYPAPATGYIPGACLNGCLPNGGHGNYAPPTVIHSGNGTTVTTTSAGGYPSGTYVNGYYYPPATVTTVTVASAPVVTTTTEVFEDSVTYSKPVVHRKVWRRPTKIVPRCRCD